MFVKIRLTSLLPPSKHKTNNKNNFQKLYTKEQVILYSLIYILDT